MESKWILNFFSYRYTFDSQRISHGFLMGPQWILNFSRIDILWIPHGFPMGSQWTPQHMSAVLQMNSQWIPIAPHG